MGVKLMGKYSGSQNYQWIALIFTLQQDNKENCNKNRFFVAFWGFLKIEWFWLFISAKCKQFWQAWVLDSSWNLLLLTSLVAPATMTPSLGSSYAVNEINSSYLPYCAQCKLDFFKLLKSPINMDVISSYMLVKISKLSWISCC